LRGVITFEKIKNKIHVKMPEIINKRRKKCKKIFKEVGISVILLWK